MLTRLIVRNFKRFREIEVDLDEVVVFIGPNNSGKTTALQALALWQAGLSKWNEKRKGKRAPEQRTGVTINRRDLVAVPVPEARLLWRDLHTHAGERGADGKAKTKVVRIEVVVDGVTRDAVWQCGLEFDYANPESLYCRPLRLTPDGGERMPVPDEAREVRVALLPPMSGLAANEALLQPGAVNVRIGEGRTAEVLRNLCYAIHERDPGLWEKVAGRVAELFGAELEPPQLVPGRGEIDMTYVEKDARLDLSSAGRGLQQTLLLLAYMYNNPGAVLLLDEPDAHLEILRQRQTYHMLVEAARANGNQVIAGSHSEVLLEEAAQRHVLVAFLGQKPHRVDDRGSQVLKALRDISYKDYYQAEQTGWVLYLEGSTDLAMLRALAARLGHEDALAALGRPFVHYVGNQPNEVRKHFHGLREAIPHLRGLALFDRLERELPDDLGAEGLTWRRREIENYVCSPESLVAYARAEADGILLEEPHVKAMREAISVIEDAMGKLGRGSPWEADTKVSDDFLPPLFEAYFSKLGLPDLMRKRSYCELAHHVPVDKIDPEVPEKLDAIARVAASAQPAGELE